MYTTIRRAARLHILSGKRQIQIRNQIFISIFLSVFFFIFHSFCWINNTAHSNATVFTLIPKPNFFSVRNLWMLNLLGHLLYWFRPFLILKLFWICVAAGFAYSSGRMWREWLSECRFWTLKRESLSNWSKSNGELQSKLHSHHKKSLKQSDTWIWRLCAHCIFSRGDSFGNISRTNRTVEWHSPKRRPAEWQCQAQQRLSPFASHSKWLPAPSALDDSKKRSRINDLAFWTFPFLQFL